jgi:hypothetical protein
MLLVVALACVAAALMIALISLSPRRERMRVPHRTMIGLDRRRQQVHRRMRVTEALAQHQRRLEQQQAELRLSLATRQPPLPRDQWSRPDPAVGVRRGISLPMQPIAPYWQNWTPAPSTRFGYGYSYLSAAAPPNYMEPPALAS